MFPSTRARLTHLALPEGMVTHPQRIARALRDAWQPIWRRRENGPSAEEINRWLADIPLIDASLLPIAPTTADIPIDDSDPDSPPWCKKPF